MNQRLNVCFPDELMAALDEYAARGRYTRSEATRLIIECALGDWGGKTFMPPTLPNWQTEAWTALLRGIFGDERLVLTDEIRPLLVEAVAGLNERQRRVLELRFGLDGPRLTLEETAATAGWNSRERVRQVEALALRRVRGWCRVRGIWKLVGPQLNKEVT